MRVMMDLDGVIFDFAESLRRYLRSIDAKCDFEKETTCWNFYEEWGISLKQFVKYCNDGADAGYVFVGPTRPGAHEALWDLKSGYHEIHVITDRSFGSYPEVSHKHTINWLAEHNLPYDSLTFSADKTIVETDIGIEDKLENAYALYDAGVKVFLVDRPWNQEGPSHAYRRVESITEFAHIVRTEFSYQSA